ncbi:hypothetical protein D9M68_739560 [compost metagenome]
MAGVGFAQGLGDVLHIDLGIGQVLPGVRVGHLVAVLIEHQRQHPGAGVDACTGGFAAGDQAIQPGFEAQAVGDDQVGVEHGLGVFGAGLVDMGVGIGTDQIAQLELISANLLGNVGQNTETGNHLEFFCSVCRECKAQGQQGDQGAHGCSSIGR